MSSSVAVGRHLLDRPATAECEGRRPRASLEIKKRDDAMFAELMAVIGMASETSRLATGYRVPIDAAFEQ